MRDIHPDVWAGLRMGRELQHRIAEIRERTDAIVARRPSPSGMVIPEVDAWGKLRSLHLAPGTCLQFGSRELATEIMAAIAESTLDARRQYTITMNDPAKLPRPFSEALRDWQEGNELKF